ncbi:MAG: ABC transporter permease/substrate-binding protein [Aerococcus sp.]|nr:ABC transporter permease/substrate-binding protein [Aerococcus sp.]
MSLFFDTLLSRREALIQATIEHLSLSLTALFIACLIAIPLAIWLYYHPRYSEFALQVAGILQTIPSLALLGLLIPLVGIGTVPAIIALVIYAILPVLQNTFVGLNEIDPSLKEAMEAFGMSKWRRLRKVEIPLALPLIISGVRTSLVLTIGTATLAALIGANGLGTFILLGIDRNNAMLTLIGALSSALLAMIFSGLIKWLQTKSPKVILTSIMALMLGIGGIFGANALMNEASVNVTIAGKLGSEPDILINMYKELIEGAMPNAKVTLKANFGKTSFLFSALENHQIDIYPEFTGTVLDSLVDVTEQERQQVATSSEETYQLAKDKLAEQKQLTLLSPLAYQNTYAIAVKEDFANQHHIETISDLEKFAPSLKAGFTLEFIDRQDGYKGLQNKYGFTFGTVQSLEPSLRYQAIANGDIEVVDAYSTDSELEQYHLKVLKDDRQLFPPYQGAPLLSMTFAHDQPELVQALNRLAGKITEDDMRQMNYQVNVEGKEPAAVAHDYLVKHQLVEVKP